MPFTHATYTLFLQLILNKLLPEHKCIINYPGKKPTEQNELEKIEGKEKSKFFKPQNKQTSYKCPGKEKKKKYSEMLNGREITQLYRTVWTPTPTLILRLGPCPILVADSRIENKKRITILG